MTAAADALRLDDGGLVHPNGHRALRGVSLRLARGERAAVIGPSGAGKTTLVRVLGTSLRPTEGRLAIGGADPWQLGAGALRRLRS
ncbi:MAG: ATP-binding cassette domain-containing protein, partial [Caldimonas sp.]